MRTEEILDLTATYVESLAVVEAELEQAQETLRPQVEEFEKNKETLKAPIEAKRLKEAQAAAATFEEKNKSKTPEELAKLLQVEEKDVEAAFERMKARLGEPKEVLDEEVEPGLLKVARGEVTKLSKILVKETIEKTKEALSDALRAAIAADGKDEEVTEWERAVGDLRNSIQAVAAAPGSGAILLQEAEKGKAEVVVEAAIAGIEADAKKKNAETLTRSAVATAEEIAGRNEAKKQGEDAGEKIRTLLATRKTAGVEKVTSSGITA